MSAQDTNDEDGQRSSPAVWIALLAVAAAIVLVTVLAVMMPLMLILGKISSRPGAGGDTTTSPAISGCNGKWTGTVPPDAKQLTQQQLSVAAVIYQVAMADSMGHRGAVIGIMTALQESSLGAAPGSDQPDQYDNAGPFQQRVRLTWHAPTLADANNLQRSAHIFYVGRLVPDSEYQQAKKEGISRLNPPGYTIPGLKQIRRWEQMAPGDAAQAVQGSAFPDAYAKWEQVATALVTTLSGQPSTAASSADCGATVEATPGGPVVLPVSGYTLTARFGQCGPRWKHCHTGLDFAAPRGTELRAVSAGVVTFSGWAGSYGNLTKIDHGNGVASWYAHQSVRNVQVGTQVKAGQPIGRVGATGNTNGPHLHLEIRQGGSPVDPMRWLQSQGLNP